MPAKPGKAQFKKPEKPVAGKSYGPLLSVVAVLVFTLLLYRKAIFSELTYFDDDGYILKNPFIRDLSLENIKAIFTTFYSGNYHPLTTFTWLVEYSCFGANPLPYHLTNVLLHVVNVWLVYLVAKRLSGSHICGLIVSVLFAVHPMHVESVAWISELKDVQYGAFYLLSLWFYLRYMDERRNVLYVGALLLFICSLLSKSAAVTLPVLLVAVDIYKGRKTDTRALMEKIPFFIPAIVIGVFTIAAQHGSITNLSLYYSPLNRVFLFTSGLAFYFVKLVAPYPLSAAHFMPVTTSGWLEWYYYLSLPLLLLIIWFTVRKSAFRKELVFGMLFFLITISVMLQVVSVGFAYAAERYSYIPYIGLFYIVGRWLTVYVQETSRKTALGVLMAVCVTYSALTLSRVDVWKDSNTLFADIIEKDPQNSDARFIYWSWGNANVHEGRLRDALQNYTEAILRYSKFENAYYCRGVVYDALGDRKTAMNDFDKAISLNPKLADAYNARGWLHYETGDTVAAMNDYNKSVLLKNSFLEKLKYAEALNNRGWAYYGMHDTTAALRDFEEAASVDKEFSRPFYNIAMIKAARQDYKGAIAIFDKLLKKKPDDATAYFNRGQMYYSQKNNVSACEDWRKAAELGNEYARQMVQNYCH